MSEEQAGGRLAGVAQECSDSSLTEARRISPFGNDPIPDNCRGNTNCLVLGPVRDDVNSSVKNTARAIKRPGVVTNMAERRYCPPISSRLRQLDTCTVSNAIERFNVTAAQRRIRSGEHSVPVSTFAAHARLCGDRTSPDYVGAHDRALLLRPDRILEIRNRDPRLA